MIRKFIISLVVCIFVSSVAFANEGKELLLKGIKYYKDGNYLGTVQTMEKVIKNNPGSGLAYYYTAISYVKLGETSKAQEFYSQVITVSPNSQLSKYSEIGLKLLTPVEPKADPAMVEGKSLPDVSSPENVEKELEERNIKYLIDKVNRKQNVDPSEYQDFKDFSPGKSSIDKPNEEDIAKAWQTLMKAGINPMQNANYSNPAMNPALTPEMIQMSMLTSAMGGMNGMGGMGMQQGGGNSSANMLPLLMMMQAQNSQMGGQAAGNNFDPQFMQSMLTNMMMPNMADFFENKEH
ncbi:MAG: hypothetical protein A2Y25_06580 [Candidatus Melainabacteria bacterium GWF2_37_15]|nr:MAG: hypothetical protein A2Y25_06580 [Candidatus Melainabacteria bacterium GWF2_37_15]